MAIHDTFANEVIYCCLAVDSEILYNVITTCIQSPTSTMFEAILLQT